MGLRTISSISHKARRALYEYNWPGNIRELRNNIEHAFALGEGGILNLEDLTPELQGRSAFPDSELDRSEKKRLTHALEKTRGNRSKAADLCDLSRSTFWRKCKLYGIC